MAQAKRDDNQVTTLLAVSNSDGITPVVLWANPTTHRLLVSATSGALDDLSDVVITSGAQGDILYHNGTNWVNLAAGTNGHFLKTQGAAANPTWAAATAGAAGTDTQVQFNDGGVNLGGDAGLTYNKTTDVLTVTGGITFGSGAVLNFDASDVTITHSANTLTLAGGNLALGANSLTMTGSIAATGARVTKGWFTDLESTNMPTVGGTAILTSLTAPQFTTIELGHASDTTIARSSAGVITVEGNTVWHAGNDGAGSTLDADLLDGKNTGTSGNVVPLLDGTNTWSGLQTMTLGGVALRVLNTTDGASVQVLKLEGDRATVADNDEGYVSLILSDDAGNQDEQARIAWKATTVANGATQDGQIILSTLLNGSITTILTLGGATTASTFAGNLSIGTSNAFTAGTIELGAASDTTIARAAAGRLTVEAVAVARSSSGSATDNTLARFDSTTGDLIQTTGIVVDDSNNVSAVGTFSSGTITTTGSIELGHASDTTLSRVSAGVVAVEGVNVLTVAGGTLTGNIVLGENTSIDLDPAGSADGKYTGICITGTAGATLAFGDLIYLAVADSRWELTDADAAATAGTPLIGMCVLAAAADGNATKILLYGQIRADAKFPALTIGATVYVGETAGAIQVAIPTGADNIIRVVGHALTADEILFNPSQDHQVTVA